jgi:hypothetical protein
MTAFTGRTGLINATWAIAQARQRTAFPVPAGPDHRS